MFPALPQDPKVRELFSEIKKYRDAWAEQKAHEHWSDWKPKASPRLEESCYIAQGPESPDPSPQSSGYQTDSTMSPNSRDNKKPVDLKAEQQHFAESVMEYACEFVEGCTASGILLTESQKQELQQVFRSMEALEASATLGWYNSQFFKTPSLVKKPLTSASIPLICSISFLAISQL